MNLDEETRALWRAAGTGDVHAAQLFLARLLRAQDRAGHVTPQEEKIWKDELALLDLLGVPANAPRERATIVVESYYDNLGGPPRAEQTPRWRVASLTRGHDREGQRLVRVHVRDRAPNTVSMGREVYRTGDGSLTFESRFSGGPNGATRVGIVVGIYPNAPEHYDVADVAPQEAEDGILRDVPVAGREPTENEMLLRRGVPVYLLPDGRLTFDPDRSMHGQELSPIGRAVRFVNSGGAIQRRYDVALVRVRSGVGRRS